MPTATGEASTSRADGDVFTRAETDVGPGAGPTSAAPPGPPTTSPVDGSSAATARSDAAPITPPVVESLPAVAETGVPGIDSDDAFCRAWSEYAGSFAALAFAWEVRPPAEAARLEVAAAPALRAAVADLAEALPDELEAQREAFTVDFPAPMLRRSSRAITLLGEAGADDAAIAALGEAWIDELADEGFDSPTLDVDAPPAPEALAAAAADFAAAVPSIREDPSLDTTAIDISEALDHLSANCPDQGTLAGDDDVGGDTG